MFHILHISWIVSTGNYQVWNWFGILFVCKILPYLGVCLQQYIDSLLSLESIETKDRSDLATRYIALLGFKIWIDELVEIDRWIQRLDVPIVLLS